MLRKHASKLLLPLIPVVEEAFGNKIGMLAVLELSGCGGGGNSLGNGNTLSGNHNLLALFHPGH
jgi:hypothetical protein